MANGQLAHHHRRPRTLNNHQRVAIDPFRLFARKACPADLAQAINDINDTQDAFKLHHGVITIRKLLSRIYNEDIIEELRESEAIVVLHRLIDQ